MSTCRLTIRPLAFLATASLLGIVGTSSAEAGCFDRLYGRSSNVPTYAPYAGAPVSTGAPVTITTQPGAPGNVAAAGIVQAQRPAYGAPVTSVQTFNNPSVYSGLPVTNSATVSASRLPITAPYVPAGSTPYTTNRLPITTQPQTVYRAPLQVTTPMPVARYAPTVTAAPAPVTSFYGSPVTAANRVPIASTLRGNATVNPIVPAQAYTSFSPSSVAPVTYNAPIQTAAPAAPRSGCFGCGLSRFFNSTLGSTTNYSTSYYRAPITYYRPMTSVNPVTGTTVTVQQPCSSYVQQLQRVPYNTFIQPAAAAPVQAPVQNCPDPCATTYGTAPNYGACPTPGYPTVSTPGTFAPPIGQVGGQSVQGISGVTPIPSIVPSNGFPNTVPLSGGSMSGGSPSVATPPASDPADQQNVPQPRLETQRPDLSAPLTGQDAPAETPSEPSTQNSYGDDIYPYGTPPEKPAEAPASDPESSSPSGPAIQLDPPVTKNSNGTLGNETQFTVQTPPSLQPTQAPISPQFSTIRPIGVPSEDQPTSTEFTSEPVAQPPSTERFQPPPLPVPSGRDADASALFRNLETSAAARVPSSRDRVSVPVREATTRHESVRQVSAWEETRPSTQSRQVFSPSRETSPQQLAPTRRDSGGWLPAQ